MSLVAGPPQIENAGAVTDACGKLTIVHSNYYAVFAFVPESCQHCASVRHRAQAKVMRRYLNPLRGHLGEVRILFH
jgi:hypothetical protein